MFTTHSFPLPATDTSEHHIIEARALTTGPSDQDYIRLNHDSKTLSHQTKTQEQINTELETLTIGQYKSVKCFFLCSLKVSFTFSAVSITVCNKGKR